MKVEGTAHTSLYKWFCIGCFTHLSVWEAGRDVLHADLVSSWLAWEVNSSVIPKVTPSSQVCIKMMESEV